MGRNDIGFVIAGGLHFDQHLVRQADDSRTGLADKAFTSPTVPDNLTGTNLDIPVA